MLIEIERSGSRLVIQYAPLVGIMQDDAVIAFTQKLFAMLLTEAPEAVRP